MKSYSTNTRALESRTQRRQKAKQRLDKKKQKKEPYPFKPLESWWFSFMGYMFVRDIKNYEDFPESSTIGWSLNYVTQSNFGTELVKYVGAQNLAAILFMAVGANVFLDIVEGIDIIYNKFRKRFSRDLEFQ